MSDLLDLARTIGWREALHRHFAPFPNREYRLEYACSEARADFRFLLPIEPPSIVVDIGSGWGNIAVAFARTCSVVFALDIDRQNCQFVRLRAEQEGLRNLIVAESDVLQLPLPDNTCDIATMVGVLEWVPRGHSGCPQALQQRALQEVHRVLKPGGYLYLAIENRFSFKYFLGGKEPHTGLRFVSLLPQSLGDVYSRLVRKKPYHEVTYSFDELRLLLCKIGFDPDVWLPIPGYQNFRFLVSAQDDRGFKFVLTRLGTHPRYHTFYRRLALLALRLRLGHRFIPCFSVIARKNA